MLQGLQSTGSAFSSVVAEAELSQICNRFKSKGEQIFEVEACGSSNLLRPAVDLNANPCSHLTLVK